MAKAVGYTLLTTAFIIFMVFSPKKQHGHANNGASRRLGYKFPVPAFDPLVTKIERLAEEKGLGNNHGHISAKAIVGEAIDEDDDDDVSYDYFNDDGRLNITLRLIILFPLLDTAPKDGLVSLEELVMWNEQQADERLSFRTLKELRLRDKDGDDAVSFSEYLPQFSQKDIEKNGTGHGEAGWWMQQFINADVDRNGSLDLDEFNNFLHPEDSSNEDIQKWLLSEKIKGMDYNHDGKLDFIEFLERTYDIYKTYAEFENAGEKVPTAEEKFAELDKNSDKYLVADELRPMLHYLQPGELSYANYYSTYLIHEADDNRDGKLSLEEMLDHEYFFYNTIFENSMDEDGDDFHDEL